MSATAPKPPSTRLIVATSVFGGFTIAAWATIILGIAIFDSIPAERQITYIVLGLATLTTTSFLGTKYAVQRHRRNAWWDGFAAGDESLAEVIPLRELKGYEGSNMKFVVSSPK